MRGLTSTGEKNPSYYTFSILGVQAWQIKLGSYLFNNQPFFVRSTTKFLSIYLYQTRLIKSSVPKKGLMVYTCQTTSFWNQFLKHLETNFSSLVAKTKGLAKKSVEKQELFHSIKQIEFLIFCSSQNSFSIALCKQDKKNFSIQRHKLRRFNGPKIFYSKILTFNPKNPVQCEKSVTEKKISEIILFFVVDFSIP